MESPYKKLKVAELKEQLAGFGESTKGRKAELCTRLQATVQKTLSRPGGTGPVSYHNRRTRAQKLVKAVDAGMATTASSSSASSAQGKENTGESKQSTGNIQQDMQELGQLTRSEIIGELEQSGKTGKEGATFIKRASSGREYAIKLFKKSKSPNTMQAEADLQQQAASFGICPEVLTVNRKEKYIVMQRLDRTILDVIRERKPRSLTDSEESRIIEIMNTLDEAGVLQNDGNLRNLMYDFDGQLKVIDFGFAKPIKASHRKKFGPNPNTATSLWMFAREFKKYKTPVPALAAHVSSYRQQYCGKKKK